MIDPTIIVGGAIAIGIAYYIINVALVNYSKKHHPRAMQYLEDRKKGM